MLNTFPHLLVLGFFAPTLIRLVVAGMFAYLAYAHLSNRGRASGGRADIIVMAFVCAIVALGLLFGAYTQICAIAAVLIGAAHLLFRERFAGHEGFGKSTYFLLVVMSLSLIVSGAGAFALDLPL